MLIISVLWSAVMFVHHYAILHEWNNETFMSSNIFFGVVKTRKINMMAKTARNIFSTKIDSKFIIQILQKTNVSTLTNVLIKVNDNKQRKNLYQSVTIIVTDIS